ncbi:hypothetical protein CJ030_MR5G015905 [Morella rubra]|uniref:Uncharacterized protein n=1 Tax=Morella rubra TaxID=262757 RepID=A0A6A1VME9_9ROSI|nr:hypothetical protein CJ030_MR5G015905 [Morella rubra]
MTSNLPLEALTVEQHTTIIMSRSIVVEWDIKLADFNDLTFEGRTLPEVVEELGWLPLIHRTGYASKNMPTHCMVSDISRRLTALEQKVADMDVGWKKEVAALKEVLKGVATGAELFPLTERVVLIEEHLRHLEEARLQIEEMRARQLEYEALLVKRSDMEQTMREHLQMMESSNEERRRADANDGRATMKKRRRAPKDDGGAAKDPSGTTRTEDATNGGADA